MQRRSTRSSKKVPSPVRDLEPSKPVRNTRTTGRNNLCNTDSESSNSDQDFVKKNAEKTPKKQKRKITDTSSSESDIENYLKPVSEIDLNSSFFKSSKNEDDISSFDNIEEKIFSDIKVTRLSDSDSSENEDTENDQKESLVPNTVPNDESIEKENLQSIKEGDEIAKINFQRLQDYSKKIEEAKKSVEQYQAKQLQENVEKEQNLEEKINIEDLLAIGETKQNKDNSVKGHKKSVIDTKKETYSDSEQEDWEEIKESQTNEQESLIPRKELEITVEMPSNLKKKKGNDLLAAVKRRLNRIRKENQLLIHKVHLLCWIAHGNYVNSILNDQSMLALGLSLIPSEKSFPSGRIDLKYLEQILKWYKKTVKLTERKPPENMSLENVIIEQVAKREAYSKNMLAMIFIIILRSLGIQCRLVLSLQVEPLRPPSNDLHFLGNSSGSKDKAGKIERKNKKETGEDFSETDDSGKEKTNKMKTKAKIKSLPKVQTNDKTPEEKNEPSSSKDIKMKKKHSDSTSKTHELTKKNNSSPGHESFKNSEGETSKYFRESRSDESGKIIRLNYKKNDKNEKKEIKKDVSEHRGSTKSSKQDKNKRETTKPLETDMDINRRSSRQSLRTNEAKQGEANKNAISKESNPEKKNRGTKTKEKDKDLAPRRVTRANSKSPSVDSSQNIRSKSASTLKVKLERIDENNSKLRSKSSSSCKDDVKRKRIPQLDGLDDSAEFKGFEESPKKRKTADNKSFEKIYSQLYKKVTNESPNVDLKKLKLSSSSDNDDCKSRKHRRSVKKLSYEEKNSSDSENEFEDSLSKKRKSSERSKNNRIQIQESSKKNKVNLQKLRGSKSTKIENSENKSPKNVMDVRQDIMNLIKGRITEQKHIDRSKLAKKRKPTHESDSEDSDYVPEPIKKKYHDSDDEFYPKMKVKKRVQVKEEVKKIKKKKPKDSNSRKVISSDSEYTEEEVVTKKEDVTKKEESVKKKKGSDTWLEVFLEMEEKWISVDVVFGQAHCVNELYSRASHPVSYVLAWNNNNHIKDITRRYCQNFNTVTRKLRIEAQWWEESLKPFIGPKNARDREEDDELDRQQQEKPLPTTISEYKNHPLYALERHLLKFEALYPPNAVPLGYVRNEPVYSRDCVFVCHSRDIWLKQAKVVKRKEKPYKIVKARPKYDKLSNTMITDQLLEIFGPWQVEDYDPPTAENGVVPRNAFGNVDLFKPSMLPKKCVHLRLPGLNKTAKRLNIDCASAIVGFDFHGGWSHPVYDGFIVCEEYEDELVAAWNMEQEEQELKDQEKYEKRVYGNWKKLIKGLMIRERLKAKYGFGQNERAEPESLSEPKEKKPKVLKKKRMVISDSSEDE